MSPDARSSQVAATTRADIARLTLRLRTALRDADEAERAHPEISGVSAELEARLSAMLDERRIAMDAELAAARDESARRIAEAHARADELLARRAAERAAIAAELAERAAEQRAAEQRAAEQRAAEQRAAEQRAAEQRAAEQRAAEAAAFDLRSSPVDAFDPWAPTVPPASGSHPGSSTSSAWAPFEAGEPVTESPSAARRSSTGFPQVVGPVPPVISTNVVIDAEAFARVFAQVVGQMIDERIAPQHAVGLPYVQHVAPPPAPVPVKQSFWANARHLDVMLLGLTSVIVLVVLAAWLV